MSNAVMVDMHWDGAHRTANVLFPPDIEAEMEQANLPSGGAMSLESALSFAIFVGLRQQLPVRLCGDPSVWNELWGMLEIAN